MILTKFRNKLRTTDKIVPPKKNGRRGEKNYVTMRNIAGVPLMHMKPIQQF